MSIRRRAPVAAAVSHAALRRVGKFDVDEPRGGRVAKNKPQAVVEVGQPPYPLFRSFERPAVSRLAIHFFSKTSDGSIWPRLYSSSSSTPRSTRATSSLF